MTEHASRLSLADETDLLTKSEPRPARKTSPSRVGAPRPKRRRGNRPFFFAALAAVLAAGGWLAWSTYGDELGRRSAASARYLTDVAAKAPFRLTVREKGTVDSLKSVTLSNKVEGTTTIISIVSEGTQVKEGDLLVELDSSLLVEEQKQQVILVTQAAAALKKAEEGLAIQERQNESDVAAAELALLLADLDFKKYVNGEYPQLLNEQLGLVQVATEELKRASDVYEFSKRLAQKGYASKNQLETDRIAMTKADINLKAAQEKLEVLKEYTKQRTEAELSEKAEEGVRALERVRRQGIAALAQFEADLEAARLTLKVEQEKLQRAETQIANSKIYAPQAGEVVYAVDDDRDQEDMIKEGASIRERKAIIDLPDLSQMKVDARIHESLVSRVREGLPARIRIDAVPGKVFTGKVISVSSVPVNGDWMRPDLKEYSCVVSIDYTPGEDAQLKPGLTAEVEIVVQQRPDVLQVPFQSVVTAGRTRYAYVLTPEGTERREVLTGAANDTHVEILDGIAEGEKVILNPRTHFADELAGLDGPDDDGFGKPDGEADEATTDSEAASAEASPGRQPGGPSDGAPAAGDPSGEGSAQAGAGGPAGGQSRDPAEFFKGLDKNADGGVTADEMPSFMAGRFATLDANADGKVDAAEFAEAAKSFRPPGAEAGGPGGSRGPGGPGGGAGRGGRGGPRGGGPR